MERQTIHQIRRVVPYAARDRIFSDGRATIIAAFITVAGHWLVASQLPPLSSPRDLPAGTVLIAYEGIDPSAYGKDWALCGNAQGTPNLNGKFLMGASQEDVEEDAEKNVGSSTHQHSVTLLSSPGPEGKYRDPRNGGVEGADNGVGNNWEHQHLVEGDTTIGSNLPPARKVLFLCKS